MDNRQKKTKSGSFIERFSNVTPEEQFSAKLEERLLLLNDNPSDSFDSSNISNFSFLNSMSKFIKVAAPLFAIFFILSTVLVYQNKFWITSRYELWTLDQDSVLSKISGYSAGAANTGENLINSRLQAFAANGISAEADSAMTPSMMPIYIDGKSYSYSKETITPGAANGKCATMSSYGVYTDKAVTFENQYYNTLDAGRYLSYYKSTSVTEDGKILSFYLSNDEGSYTYFGGDYALKIENIPYETFREESGVSTDPDSAAAETSPTVDDAAPPPEEPVADSDSDRAVDGVIPSTDDSMKALGKVVDIVQIGGKEAYVIESSFETSCDISKISIDSYSDSYMDNVSSTSAEDMRVVLIRGWYDKSDYSLIKSESYLGSYGVENLISTVESSYETSDKSVEQVKDLFKFDVKTSVVSIEYPYVEYDPKVEKAKLLSELRAEEYKVFVPSVTGTKLTSINVTTEADYYDPAAEHYNNRRFYAAGTEGTAMYNEFKSYQVDKKYNSVLDYSFNSDTLDTNVSMYKDMTLSDALKYFYTEPASLTDGTIKIGGELVSVKVFKENYGGSRGMEPGAAGAGDDSVDIILPPDSGNAEEYFYSSYIFEYKGDVYFMSISSTTAQVDVVHEFTLRSTSTDYEYIRGLVENASLFEVLPVDPDIGAIPASGYGTDSDLLYTE